MLFIKRIRNFQIYINIETEMIDMFSGFSDELKKKIKGRILIYYILSF